jgi:integrase
LRNFPAKSGQSVAHNFAVQITGILPQGQIMPTVTFARVQAEVLALYRPPQRRKATHAKMSKVLREVAELGAKRSSDLSPSLIVDWLARHDDRRPATNRSYLGSLRAAANIAKKLGYLRVTPWEIRSDWIPADDEDDAEPLPRRHLTVLEIVRLLDQADADAIAGSWQAARLQALVYTYAFTGLRKCEALGLLVSDVSLPGHYLEVRGRRSRRLKTRSSRRTVAIHPELDVVLQRWLPRTECEWVFPSIRRESAWLNGGMGYRALDHVQALAGRCGLDGVTIQAIRRSIATHARRFGLGALEVKELLGHSSEQTQSWYLEDDLANQRAAIAKIDYRTCAARSIV